jgi:hypothetical protein
MGEKGVGMMEKMEFVQEIQKEKGLEDHNIEMVSKSGWIKCAQQLTLGQNC